MKMLRPELVKIYIPPRIRALPIDERGYPVPWFVSWIDGKPEFRAADAQKLRRAVVEHRCWTCGEMTGKYVTFVIGPMCAVNRISSEPPSHDDCAIFSAKACPFLSRPHMVRREGGLPLEADLEGTTAGEAISRNPGVTLLWRTLDFKLVRDKKGFLFRVGDPIYVGWYAEGRVATRAEILHSIETGLPILREMAESEGAESVRSLEEKVAIALKLVPEA